jgi:protocatechuate 3,4-dioxygenase, beta subunit
MKNENEYKLEWEKIMRKINKNKFSQQRRNFLKSYLLLGTLVATDWIIPSLSYSNCNLTPRESSGPFYPLDYPTDRDNDLTYLKDKSKKANGEIIYINGIVQDDNCQPISKAFIEIWQACATGRYNHPEDQNSAELDPNFQYWGKAVTNKRGEYGFKTIKPGSYPASWFWTRPPHIHFTVRSLNHFELTTQMYFSGESLNNKDRLLQNHSKKEREKCIISFYKKKQQQLGQFNLTLKRKQSNLNR